MFVLTYLLFAIILAIIVGRAGTVFKDFSSQYRKQHYSRPLQKQTAK